MGKVLLSAPSFGCLSEMLSIAAMTGLQGSVWFTHEGEKKAMEGSRRQFAVEEGDHMTLLNVYQAFVTRGRKDAKWCRDNHLNHKSMLRAVSIRNQLKRYLERLGLSGDESPSSNGTQRASNGSEKAQQIRKCLTAGYFAHAARMQPDGTFKSVSGGLTMYAHPTSLMFVSAASPS
jgi:ATP-dependent RNA helicase DDX35